MRSRAEWSSPPYNVLGDDLPDALRNEALEMPT
jgi:hypothetical protein